MLPRDLAARRRPTRRPKGPAVIVKDFDLAHQQGRVRLPHRPLRLRQVDGAVDGRRPHRRHRRRRHPRRQGSRRAGPGSRRRLPVAVPAAVDDRVRQRDARRRPGLLHREHADERRQIAEYYLDASSASATRCTRSRPSCRRACASASASRARSRFDPKMLLLDEPFGMLDSLTRFELQEVLIELWRQGPEDRADGHARRRRGAVPLRPHRDDDQRPGGRRSAKSSRCVSPSRARARRVLEHPDYYRLREDLIGFLEERSHFRPAPIPKRIRRRARPPRRRSLAPA